MSSTGNVFNALRDNIVNIKKIDFILLLVLLIVISGCGLRTFTQREINPVSEDYINSNRLNAVIGTLATDAAHRVALYRLNDGKIIDEPGDDRWQRGEFCAEPPPDAMVDISGAFAAAFTAEAKVPESQSDIVDRRTALLDYRKASREDAHRAARNLARANARVAATRNATARSEEAADEAENAADAAPGDGDLASAAKAARRDADNLAVDVAGYDADAKSAETEWKIATQAAADAASAGDPNNGQKNVAKGKLDTSMIRTITTVMAPLLRRSQGLQWSRDNLSFVCNAYLNRAINKKQYLELVELINRSAVNLIKEEITENKLPETGKNTPKGGTK